MFCNDGYLVLDDWLPRQLGQFGCEPGTQNMLHLAPKATSFRHSSFRHSVIPTEVHLHNTLTYFQ